MSKSEEIKAALQKLSAEKSGLLRLVITEIVMLAIMLVLLFTVDIKAVYAAGAVTLIYNFLILRPAKKRYLANINRAECLRGVTRQAFSSRSLGRRSLRLYSQSCRFAPTPSRHSALFMLAR